MIFAPGDEVVCVNERFETLGETYGIAVPAPTLHAHYVVHSVGEFNGFELLRLYGLRPQVCEYDSRAFRPVRRESIEIFRQMAKSTKPLIPMDVASCIQLPATPGRNGRAVSPGTPSLDRAPVQFSGAV